MLDCTEIRHCYTPAHLFPRLVVHLWSRWLKVRHKTEFHLILPLSLLTCARQWRTMSCTSGQPFLATLSDTQTMIDNKVPIDGSRKVALLAIRTAQLHTVALECCTKDSI